MEAIRAVLDAIFSYVLYPAVVIGLFAFIVFSVCLLVLRATGERRIRRLVAAALPIVILVFVVIPVEEPGGIGDLLGNLYWFWRFLVGAAAGIGILELGRIFIDSDEEIGPAIYVLFLSGISMFILYSVMEDFLKSLHVVLLGIVVGGGLHVIFRGLPKMAWRS